MDIKTFKGLNNVSDPLRLGLGWLAIADNVNITDTGGIAKRQGFSKIKTGAYTGAYTTVDFSRMYLADGGHIKTFDGVVLATLASTAPMFWTEANDNVYYNNGTDSGVIAPDNTVSLWRGAPVSYGAGFKGDDGKNLTVLYDTLPLGADAIQFWRGVMYAAQYFPAEDQTVVWFSEPMGYHLFNLDSNFFIVPGQVLMLAPTKESLVVGTNNRIYATDAKNLEVLAEYGVVPGQHWSKDDEDRTLFWSTRGVCAAKPFENLTERQVSVAPGVRAGGCVMRSGGQKRYVVALQQGNSAFNSYT